MISLSLATRACNFCIFKLSYSASFLENLFYAFISERSALRSSSSFSRAIFESLILLIIELMSFDCISLFLSSKRSMIACLSLFSNSTWLLRYQSSTNSSPYKVLFCYEDFEERLFFLDPGIACSAFSFMAFFVYKSNR